MTHTVSAVADYMAKFAYTENVMASKAYGTMDATQMTYLIAAAPELLEALQRLV